MQLAHSPAISATLKLVFWHTHFSSYRLLFPLIFLNMYIPTYTYTQAIIQRVIYMNELNILGTPGCEYMYS